MGSVGLLPARPGTHSCCRDTESGAENGSGRDVDGGEIFAGSAEHAAKALNGFTNAINTLSVTEVVGESIWLGSRQAPLLGAGLTTSGDEHSAGDAADRDLFNSRTAGASGTASRSQSVVVVRR